MKLKKRYLFIVTFLLWGLTNQNDKIVYKFDDIINLKIEEFSSQIESKGMNTFCLLYNFRDTITIIVSEFNKKDNNSTTSLLIKNTSRFIELKSKKIPVLFKLDYVYSTTANRQLNNKIGSVSSYSEGGYFISFYGRYDKCKIVKTGEFR